MLIIVGQNPRLRIANFCSNNREKNPGVESITEQRNPFRDVWVSEVAMASSRDLREAAIFFSSFRRFRGALNDLRFLICIKMFILKLQARNPEKLLQANIQSPTRIKISINQMFIRLFSHRFVNRDSI